ncbi:MAG: glycosyltransferase family 2 protein [Pseudobutyrivibrio sp.]|nr:glycosyltransferase family 2 protein [Pseudobutyrivibrio sp.]
MKLSVVIPIYGCKKALPELHKRLSDTLQKITEDYEIILVNDNCPQNSWEVIEEIAQKDNKVKGIELSRNFGQMKAILAGLDYSTGDWVVVMDCDLQDRPEEIINLYNKAQEGYDIVFARRAHRKDGAMKVFLANLFYKIYRFATDGNYDGAVCNFSIVKRQVVNDYCRMREQHRAYVMYMKWLGYRQAVIDVEHNERFEGKSSYSLKKRVAMAMELLTSQSDKLLKLFVGIGFFMSLFAFIAIIALVIYHYVAHVTVGWTSLLATNVLIGGIIIMVIGIVGIYVGNTFMQTKERPLYIVRQILNDNKED